MKIESIDVEEFADGEHRGKSAENIRGDSLFFRGGSRTGKTLTFNAILYNLLGSRHTIDLATGRQNKVELEFTDGSRFFRGNPEAEYEDEEQNLTGADASEAFKEKIGDTALIRSHFVHSHIGKMPLDNLSRSKRISLVREVTNDELRQEYIDFWVPELRDLGLEVPDDRLEYDDGAGKWIYTRPDMDELERIRREGGPESRRRLDHRKEVFEETAWVREALESHYQTSRGGRVSNGSDLAAD